MTISQMIDLIILKSRLIRVSLAAVPRVFISMKSRLADLHINPDFFSNPKKNIAQILERTLSSL